jgi:hypothetical protein
VELNSASLKISPIEHNVPKEADALKEALYGMLPHVKITDLLMKVDHWTGFTRHFVHLFATASLSEFSVPLIPNTRVPVV